MTNNNEHEAIRMNEHTVKVMEQRIERALKILKSYPTPEDRNQEGFRMAHFYSQAMSAAGKILKGEY